VKSYKPSNYNFEVLECFRRLSLASMIGITDPESAISAVLGLLICLGAVYIFVGYKPYKNPKDSELGITLAFSLLLFFLSALMLKVAATASLSIEDQEIFGYMLCGVLAAGPLAMTWAEIGGKVIAVGALGFKCCYFLVRAIWASRQKRKKKKEEEKKGNKNAGDNEGEKGGMDAETKEGTGDDLKGKQGEPLAIDDGNGGYNRDRTYSRSDSSYSSDSSFSGSSGSGSGSGSVSGSGVSGSEYESESEEESEEESESESESEEEEDEDEEGEEEEEEFVDDTQVNKCCTLRARLEVNFSVYQLPFSLLP
jgi:uncharacterized membrane protein YgcG